MVKSKAARSSKKGRLRQVAALPIRLTALGEIEVLLLTSRETRRWVIPKGWPVRKIGPGASAAREAYEEAGVRGRIFPETPIGTFRYVKSTAAGSLDIEVEIFVLHVEEQAEKWPERAERDTRWFVPEEAAALVAEPELADILRSARQFAERKA